MINDSNNPFRKANEYSPSKDLISRVEEKMREFRRLYDDYALPRITPIEVSDSELALLYASVQLMLVLLEAGKNQEELIQMLEALNKRLGLLIPKKQAWVGTKSLVII